MQERLLTIYYGIDRLPYKDENREVHYPIVSSQSGGTLITGENNTSKLYFYVGRIGGGACQWIVNVVKPDGTKFYQLCTNGQSVTLSNGQADYRVELNISSLFADQIGDVYIGVQGYSGDTVINETEEGYYEISGDPVVLATGTIKIKVNYAPSVLPKGETLTPTVEQQIMAALGGKIDTSSSIFVVNGLTGFDFSGFDNYQTFFDIETGQFYRKVGSSLSLIELELKDMLIEGTKLTTYLGQYITTAQATQSFVAKVDSPSIVYGRNSLNQEATYGVDPTNSYGQTSIPLRYNGQVKGPAPLNDGDYTNKKYVDDEIASAIEEMEERSDVIDIVGTYQDLEDYDTSKVKENDLIKVIRDETHNDATSYYRWENNEWVYVESEGPYPTISEMNSALDAKVDKTTSASKLYGTDSVGTQTTIPVEDNIGDVARRDDDGQLAVPLTPTANGQATSKKYVDDQDALDEKLANKVTSISDSSTDTQYPSAKAVMDLVKSMLQKSYQEVNTTEYPTLDDFLASTGEEGYIYLYPIDINDTSKGYYQYIWESNAWVDLGTTSIDLSNCYQKNESLIPSADNTYDIGSSTYKLKDLYLSGKIDLYNAAAETSYSIVTNQYNIQIKRGTSNLLELGTTLMFIYKPVLPASTGFDFGNSVYKWRTIYCESISDGTNSYTVGDSYSIIFGKYVADNTITTLPYENISEIKLSSDTTFSLKSAPTGCYPEYRAIIKNVGSSAINLTFTSIVAIICNDASVVISGNVLTLPVGMELEISIENGALVAINWSL